MQPCVLIVDDKDNLCKILAHDFHFIGFRSLYATSAEDALKVFKAESPNVVLLDLMMGTTDSLHLLSEFIQTAKGIPVIMMTGYATIETAVKAIRLGARDYLQKPLSFAKVQSVVEEALGLAGLTPGTEERIANTSSPLMKELVERIRRMAITDISVMLLGESGTGKDLLAELIHQHSARAAKPLHKINCAALPANLLENELFGHEKGAYTGAAARYKGIFEQADGGTLFLDEIGDMPLDIQAKILRTLQNREVRRIGGSETILVDVRFIAATNKNLPELVRTGQFREDLFYRLNTAMLSVPPLRSRKEDIPELIELFLHEGPFAKAGMKVDGEVSALFQDYSWRGNIRELKNVLHFAIAMATGPMIKLADLPPYLLMRENPAPVEPDEHEKSTIVRTLEQCRYNKKKASEILNISRRTLYNKLEKYGIKG